MADLPMDKLRAAKAQADAFTGLRETYAEVRVELVEQRGWTKDDVAELDACIKADFADCPGVARPFLMQKSERIECWSNWFDEKLCREKPMLRIVA